MPFLLIVSVLVGIAVLMFFIGLARAVEPSESDRLEEYLTDRASPSSGAVSRRTGGGMTSSTGEMAQGIDKILRSVTIGDRLGHMLRSADLQMTIVEYLLIWLLCIGGGVALGYLISHSWLPAVLAGGIGALIPYIILRSIGDP